MKKAKTRYEKWCGPLLDGYYNTHVKLPPVGTGAEFLTSAHTIVSAETGISHHLAQEWKSISATTYSRARAKCKEET